MHDRNASAITERAAVFCTALIDSNPARYQSWIDYYTELFEGEGIDLYLCNDGPFSSSINFGRARVRTFPEMLGRQSVWIFPGWKRSFTTAVAELGSRYRCLGHIESDLVLLRSGRAEFLRALRATGYRTGYTQKYGFVETGIQVLNSNSGRRFFGRRYFNLAAYEREERFEKVVQYGLRPRLFLHGERTEGEIPDDPTYTYLAQMPIYRYRELCAEGRLTFSGEPSRRSPTERLRVATMRLRWTLGFVQKTLTRQLR